MPAEAGTSGESNARFPAVLQSGIWTTLARVELAPGWITLEPYWGAQRRSFLLAREQPCRRLRWWASLRPGLMPFWPTYELRGREGERWRLQALLARFPCAAINHQGTFRPGQS
jgi:hypothetical protein